MSQGSQPSQQQPPPREVTLDEAVQIAFGHYGDGRLAEAAHVCRQVLAADPNHFDAMHLLGLVAHRSGQHGQAVELLSRSVGLRPSLAGARVNLGWALRASGRPQRALEEAQAAAKLDPNSADAHILAGTVLHEAGRLDLAVGHCERRAALRPESGEAFATLAVTYERLGRLEEAARAGARAVELQPQSAVAHVNFGAALAKLGRLNEALECHRRATQLDPSLVVAWVNVAFDAQQLGLLDEAAAASRRAIELAPNDVGGHQNLAITLADQGHLDEAAASFGTAVRLLESRARQPGVPAPQAAADRRLAAQLSASALTLLPPVYDSLDELRRWRERLMEGVAKLKAGGVKLDVRHEPAPTLFALAYHGLDDAAVNRDYASLVTPPPDPVLPPRPAARGAKMRVGFISRFFRAHTIGRLNVGLIEQLDRSQFDVRVFSVGDAGDAVAERFRRAADKFVVLAPSALDVARQAIAAEDLDVLFYADIGMDPATYSLAHSRLAHVQCATWGHPVTSGIPAVDYFISSQSLETPGSERQYTEKLVKLSSLAVYYERPHTNSTKARGDFGFAAGATLYGCLQMLWKFHPEFDALLGEVLRRDPAGQLLLIAGLSASWDERLMARFRRTIPDVAGRIHFVPRQSYDDFLALTRACDVMLDPLHFGGGNTTYEALAFGVPVVTLPSQYLRGRITKALYDQMDLHDCVADSDEAYVEIATMLGRDRDARAAVRGKILARGDTIFENAAGVRELEQFFRTVVLSPS